jgi:hypothetical protein
MARASKLKVYRTAAGFHDAYVAAPSQKAALAAWGSDHDLFARGGAERSLADREAALSRERRAFERERKAALDEAQAAVDRAQKSYDVALRKWRADR